ncbi:ATP-binding protein [Deinococcus roseus]|uniref:Orc1-like AAA ATPase domain-containing protein n=1 Tax=Deinococcus roseus TaxID=392414 RepID=A0ABQ2D033_9DEIO|nr:AAA family ATPase [Deinococcus roseus]GGJ37545.1 hypothetical protein GCM10008938_24600 [Deinococcus roseus]
MHVQTLGGLDAGVKPIKPKNLLLLCYLALEGKQDRKHLQMLFWPEAADPATSLRVALSYLQSLEKDLFRSVQNQVESRIETDAQQLLLAVQQQNHTEVIQLYSGAFLKGLDLRNTSTELEDWIFETREKLASLVQWSILQEAQKIRHALPDQFKVLAEQFFQVEGAPPPTLEMLRFLHALGLEGYLEHRVLKEAAELGVDLTTLQVPQKTNLQTAIRPVQVFVGRDQELALLRERLQQTPPGIVTVTGLGGVGKSTLVRAYCAAEHPEDTLWLKADGLKDASGLLHQLGLNVQQADPWMGLMDTLRHHRGVVVIDGADQLSGLENLQNWLRFSALRIIVTCRQPLQLPEESLLKLEPFSIQEYRGMGLTEVLNHPAVQCFEKHARRHHAAFKIQSEDAQEVVQLCAALSGLPLALEMASSWVQMLSLKEIREEVQQVVDPEGDPQSLKPIFEASWHLLSEQEKQALTSLNCFLGSFTREAAVIVSGVQLRTLQQLVRKSMLQMEPGQRFRVPQVLRGFVPEPSTEVQKKHQAYYLHLLNTLDASSSQGLLDHASTIPDLMEVVRFNMFNGSAKSFSLLKIFDRSTLYYQGLQFYNDVLKDIKIQDKPDAYLEYAWMCFRSGESREALRVCDGLDEICDDIRINMISRNIRGSVYMGMMIYEKSYLLFKDAMQMAMRLKEEDRIFLYGINAIIASRESLMEDKEVLDILSGLEYSKNGYHDLYLKYAIAYSDVIRENNMKEIYVIDSIIEKSRENQFGDLELYSIYCKMFTLFLDGKAVLNNLEADIERGISLALFQGNSTMLNGILLFKLAKSSPVHVQDVNEVLNKIYKTEDNYNAILCAIFLLGHAGFDEEQKKTLITRLLEWRCVSPLSRRLLELNLSRSLCDLAEQDQVQEVYVLVNKVLDWLIFKDRLAVQEVDFQHHHRPEEPEAPHLPEPHPRSPEQSL